MARKAYWYFDCDFGVGTGESSVFTGDGLEDLNSFISRLSDAQRYGGINPYSRFLADVGTITSDWQPFDLDDVKAIRTYYVEVYGYVNKPPVTTRASFPGGPVAIPVYGENR